MLRRALVLALLSAGFAGLPVLGASSSATVHTIVPTRHETHTRAVTRVVVVRLVRPAANVVAYWRGHPHAHVTLALSDDGVHFGAPVTAGRDEIGQQRGNGTTYGALHVAAGTVAVRVSTDQPLARLSVLALGDGVAATRTRSERTLAGAEASSAQPAVVSREGWGADPTLMTWSPEFYATEKLVVHHTDTSDDYTDQAGAHAQIRSIYYYHSVTQGWGDIGYNFLIDKFGTIYEGRYSRDYAGASPTGDDASGRGVTGAHTKGWNSGTVGIALLGTLTTHDATPAARDALERLLAWEASRNGIDPQATEPFTNPVSGATITTPNIAGHRDYVATACPGDTFYPTLPTIRADTAALVAGGTPTPDTTPPTQPTNLRATAGRTQVALTWTAATDDRAVSSYQVWRSRTSSTSGFLQVGTTSSTSFTNTSLARRTTYWYRVRAVDAAGNLGPFSVVVSSRTG